MSKITDSIREFGTKSSKIIISIAIGISLIVTPFLLSENQQQSRIDVAAELEETQSTTQATTKEKITETTPDLSKIFSKEDLEKMNTPAKENLSNLEKTEVLLQVEEERSSSISDRKIGYEGEVIVRFTGKSSTVVDNQDGTMKITIHINGSVKYVPDYSNKYRLFVECTITSMSDASNFHKKIVEVDKAAFSSVNIVFDNLPADKYSVQACSCFGTAEYLAEIGR